MKTVKRTKTGQKTYCFICKSASHSPRSCTEMVTENMDKPISCDEPDSIVHIHYSVEIVFVFILRLFFNETN